MNLIKNRIKPYAILLLFCSGVGTSCSAQGVLDEVPKPVISFDAKGWLTAREGDTELIESAVPRIYFLDQLIDGEKKRPEWHWMTRPQLREFDAGTNTFTANYQWGVIVAEYTPQQQGVDMLVKVSNTTPHPFVAAWIELSGPWTFKATPRGHDVLKRGTQEVPIAIADTGSTAYVVSIAEGDDQRAIGWQQRKLILDTGSIDAGETITVKVALRAGASAKAGGDPTSLAGEAMRAYAAKHPYIGPVWNDRRPISQLHPSSAHLGFYAAKNPKNPRGWSLSEQTDVTTPEGRERFHKEMRAWFENSLKIAQEMNAQGMIVWSIEGQQFPHTISYVGSPDRLAEMAPEMDAIADEMFAIFSNAGLKVGICLRPQVLTDRCGGKPCADVPERTRWYDQRQLRTETNAIDKDAIIANLDMKIQYAKDRWGATLFYIDTNVDDEYAIDPETKKQRPVRWELHSAAIYQELTRRHPDCLIIPEHEIFPYWNGSAPLGETPPLARRVWPQALSVNLMQHFTGQKEGENAYIERLAREGDILMFSGWWRDPRNKVIREIQQRADAARK